MQQVTLEEAGAQLEDLVRRARAGAEIVITLDSEPAVRLVPVMGSQTRPRFGSARGLVQVPADFDAPLEEFAEYQ